MISGLCNPEYYRGAFLEIRKSMEVREEGMEMQEEAALSHASVSLVKTRSEYFYPYSTSRFAF